MAGEAAGDASAAPEASAASSPSDGTGRAGGGRKADLELARRIVAGDGDAFDCFYEEHVERVYAVVLRLCGDGAVARRLTQDAFVRAWRGMSTYRGDSRLSSWLYRIATNVALEKGRRRTRWWSRLAPDPVAVEDRPGRSGDPELRMDLERAIAALPPGAREVLVLRDVQGHSYKEIVGLTGLAMGTVKAQIHRARKLVREALER